MNFTQLGHRLHTAAYSEDGRHKAAAAAVLHRFFEGCHGRQYERLLHALPAKPAPTRRVAGAGARTSWPGSSSAARSLRTICAGYAS